MTFQMSIIALVWFQVVLLLNGAYHGWSFMTLSTSEGLGKVVFHFVAAIATICAGVAMFGYYQ